MKSWSNADTSCRSDRAILLGMDSKMTTFIGALKSGLYSNWTVPFVTYMVDEWRAVDAVRQHKIIDAIVTYGERTPLVDNLVFVMILDIVRLRAERVLTQHEATCHCRLWSVATAAVRGRVQELAMLANWYPTRGAVAIGGDRASGAS